MVPWHGVQRPKRKLNAQFCIAELELQRHPRNTNNNGRDSERNQQAEKIAARPPEILVVALPEICRSGYRKHQCEDGCRSPNKARMQLRAHRPNEKEISHGRVSW